jgi:hypothetical protein
VASAVCALSACHSPEKCNSQPLLLLLLLPLLLLLMLMYRAVAGRMASAVCALTGTGGNGTVMARATVIQSKQQSPVECARLHAGLKCAHQAKAMVQQAVQAMHAAAAAAAAAVLPVRAAAAYVRRVWNALKRCSGIPVWLQFEQLAVARR